MSNSKKFKLGGLFSIIVAIVMVFSTIYFARGNYNENTKSLYGASNVAVSGFSTVTEDGIVWNLIKNVSDLKNIENNLSAYYRLDDDIKINSSDLIDG